MKAKKKEEQIEMPITDDVANLGKSQDFLFQLICHESGHRSEPFVSDWSQMMKILRARQEEAKPHDLDYILLVAVMDKEQTYVPSTPLITVKRFLEIMPQKIKD